MESVLPRSVLFVEDIEGLAAEYRGTFAHHGSNGHGLEAAEVAAAGKRDEGAQTTFARSASPSLHGAASHLDVPRALGDNSNDRPSGAYYSQYRQR